MHSYFLNILFFKHLSLFLSQSKLPFWCNHTKTPAQCNIFYPLQFTILQQVFANAREHPVCGLGAISLCTSPTVWRDEDVNSDNTSSTVGGDGGECFKNRDRGREKAGSHPRQPLLAGAFTPGAGSALHWLNKIPVYSSSMSAVFAVTYKCLAIFQLYFCWLDIYINKTKGQKCLPIICKGSNGLCTRFQSTAFSLAALSGTQVSVWYLHSSFIIILDIFLPGQSCLLEDWY